MTRDEAFKIAGEINEVCYGVLTEIKPNIFHLIDKIYDEFESRTCENCKHFVPSEVNYVLYPDQNYCMEDISMDSDFTMIEYNFGCNRWESND